MQFVTTICATHIVETFHVDRGGLYLPMLCGEVLERHELADGQEVSAPLCQSCNEAYWAKTKQRLGLVADVAYRHAATKVIRLN